MQGRFETLWHNMHTSSLYSVLLKSVLSSAQAFTTIMKSCADSLALDNLRTESLCPHMLKAIGESSIHAIILKCNYLFVCTNSYILKYIILIQTYTHIIYIVNTFLYVTKTYLVHMHGYRYI